MLSSPHLWAGRPWFGCRTWRKSQRKERLWAEWLSNQRTELQDLQSDTHCVELLSRSHSCTCHTNTHRHTQWVKHTHLTSALSVRTQSVILTQSTSSHSYFIASLDDGDGQHEDPGHGAGPSSQQHGLQGPRAAVLEEVLLQRVVGAEVDPHSGDGSGKRLEERMTSQIMVKPYVVFSTFMREKILTGEMPFHSPSSFSVRTTFSSTVTMPTLPVLEEGKVTWADNKQTLKDGKTQRRSCTEEKLAKMYEYMWDVWLALCHNNGTNVLFVKRQFTPMDSHTHKQNTWYY